MKLLWLHRVYALLFLILLLGTVVRFVGLGLNPIGFVDDEAENGYDAYSLIKTGKDQWGQSWPITSFRGFGDYRLTAYTYFTIPFVEFFGLSPLAVRMPAALFGSLTIVVVFFLAREVFDADILRRRKISPDVFALLGAFFLAISPWHIGMSRVAIEQTISVFFVSFGLLALLISRKRPRWLIASGILFGLSLFVYRPNILLVPFVILGAVILFRKSFMSHWKWLLGGFIATLIVSSPILLSVKSSAFGLRATQVNLTNDSGIVDLVNEKRGDCLHLFPASVCKVVFNKYGAYAERYLTNYLYHFSPDLLSIHGTDTQFSILPSRGLLYLVDYPLFILAIVAIGTSFSPAGIFLLGFLLFSAVPDSFTSAGHYGRFFISFPVWPIILSLGLSWALAWIHQWKRALVIVVAVYGLCLASFLVEYWTFFPYRYSEYSLYGYQQLTTDIVINKNRFDKIVVSSRINDTKQYIYYLFYTAYNPASFQSGNGIVKIVEANGWVRVKQIQNIEFLPSLPTTEDVCKDHELLIGAPTEFPKKVITQFTVKDVKGDPLFYGVDSEKLCPPPVL